jgi:hypothetical protein
MAALEYITTNSLTAYPIKRRHTTAINLNPIQDDWFYDILFVSYSPNIKSVYIRRIEHTGTSSGTVKITFGDVDNPIPAGIGSITVLNSELDHYESGVKSFISTQNSTFAVKIIFGPGLLNKPAFDQVYQPDESELATSAVVLSAPILRSLSFKTYQKRILAGSNLALVHTYNNFSADVKFRHNAEFQPEEPDAAGLYVEAGFGAGLYDACSASPVLLKLNEITPNENGALFLKHSECYTANTLTTEDLILRQNSLAPYLNFTVHNSGTPQQINILNNAAGNSILLENFCSPKCPPESMAAVAFYINRVSSAVSELYKLASNNVETRGKIVTTQGSKVLTQAVFFNNDEGNPDDVFARCTDPVNTAAKIICGDKFKKYFHEGHKITLAYSSVDVKNYTIRKVISETSIELEELPEHSASPLSFKLNDCGITNNINCAIEAYNVSSENNLNPYFTVKYTTNEAYNKDGIYVTYIAVVVAIFNPSIETKTFRVDYSPNQYLTKQGYSKLRTDDEIIDNRDWVTLGCKEYAFIEAVFFIPSIIVNDGAKGELTVCVVDITDPDSPEPLTGCPYTGLPLFPRPGFIATGEILNDYTLLQSESLNESVDVPKEFVVDTINIRGAKPAWLSLSLDTEDPTINKLRLSASDVSDTTSRKYTFSVSAADFSITRSYTFNLVYIAKPIIQSPGNTELFPLRLSNLNIYTDASPALKIIAENMFRLDPFSPSEFTYNFFDPGTTPPQSLPSGLSISPGTPSALVGQISGNSSSTPIPLTLRATNPAGSATRLIYYTTTIATELSFSLQSSYATQPGGTSFSIDNTKTFTGLDPVFRPNIISGGPAIRFELSEPEGLPAGLNFNPSTGAITGKITAPDSTTYTNSIRGVNSLGNSGYTPFTIVYSRRYAPVFAAPVSEQLINITHGAAYTEILPVFTAAASTIDGGSDNFAPGLTDTTRNKYTISYNNSTTSGFSMGLYTGKFTGTSDISWASGNTRYTATITATNPAGSATLIVYLVPNTSVDLSFSLQSSYATQPGGTSFSIDNTKTFTGLDPVFRPNIISGGPAIRFELLNATPLPGGLTFNTTSGIIIGKLTVNASGTYSNSIRGVNIKGPTEYIEFTINYSKFTAPVFASPQAGAIINLAYGQTYSETAPLFTAAASTIDGGSDNFAPGLTDTTRNKYTISYNNSTTSGFSMGLYTGKFVGAAANSWSPTSGDFPANITATNPAGSSTRAITLRVSRPLPPVVQTPKPNDLFTVVRGTTYTENNSILTPFATNNPTAWSASGLPSGSGLTISGSSGKLIGVVNNTLGANVYAVDIRAENSAGASPAVPIKIIVPIAIISPGLNQTIDVGVEGSIISNVDIVVSGVPAGATISYTAVTLNIAGLQLQTFTPAPGLPLSAKIIGTPTSAGLYTVVIRVSAQTSDSQNLGSVDARFFIRVQSVKSSIAGKITKDDGTTPIADAVVSLSALSRTATTNASGDYMLTDIVDGQYIASVSKAGFVFTPATQLITVNSQNISGVNFTGVEVISISGRIRTSNNIGISGVTVSTGTTSVSTNASGEYALIGVSPNQTITLIPSRSNYSFMPSRLTLQIATTSLQNQDFVGAIAYAVSGTITYGGQPANSLTPVLGTTIAARNASTKETLYFTTAAANGTFSLLLPTGSYELVPISYLLRFNPVTIDVTVGTTAVPNNNFNSVDAVSHMIRVLDAPENSQLELPISGASVRVLEGPMKDYWGLTDARGDVILHGLGTGDNNQQITQHRLQIIKQPYIFPSGDNALEITLRSLGYDQRQVTSWSYGTTYQVGNLVSYQGFVYRAQGSSGFVSLSPPNLEPSRWLSLGASFPLGVTAMTIVTPNFFTVSGKVTFSSQFVLANPNYPYANERIKLYRADIPTRDAFVAVSGAPIVSAGARTYNYIFTDVPGGEINYKLGLASPQGKTTAPIGEYSLNFFNADVTNKDFTISQLTATPPGTPSISSINPEKQALLINVATPPDNGAPITSFQVSLDNGATFVTFTSGINIPTSRFRISNLTNGTTYQVVVRAINVAGSSAWSAMVPAIPATPIYNTMYVFGLTGDLGNPSMSPPMAKLQGSSYIWKADELVRSPADTRYRYAVGPTTSEPMWGPGTGGVSPVSTTSSSWFEFLDTAQSGVYEFTFDNDLLTQSAIFKYGRPTSPTINSIITANGTAVVNFSQSTADVVASYEYSLDEGATWATVTPGTSSPAVIPGVLFGVDYRFGLRAVNIVGRSPSSPYRTIRGNIVPQPPENISVIARDGMVEVNFTPGPSVAGETVVNMKYSINGGSTFAARSPIDNRSPLFITDVTNGQTYNIQLKSSNDAGDSGAAPVPSISATPIADPSRTQMKILLNPGSASWATGAQMTKTGDYTWRGSATVTSATNVNFRFAFDSNSSVLGWGLGGEAGKVRRSNQAINLTDATIGIYEFTLNTQTQTYTVTKIVSLPQPPTLTSYITSPSTISFAFVAPEDNGGSPIIGYQYSISPTTTPASWIDLVEVVVVTAPNTPVHGRYARNGVLNGKPRYTKSDGCTIAWFTNGISKYWYISRSEANNSQDGVYYSNQSDAVTPNLVPASDWNVSPNASINLGISDIPLPPQVLLLSGGAFDDIGYYTISGLAPGVAVSLFLRSINILGAGNATNPATTIRPANLPASPTITGVTSPKDGELHIAYTPLTASTDTPITGYEYRVRQGSVYVDSNWSQFRGGLSERPGVIRELKRNTEYTVELRAFNRSGGGAVSEWTATTMDRAFTNIYLIGDHNDWSFVTRPAMVKQGTTNEWVYTMPVDDPTNKSVKFVIGSSWTDPHWGDNEGYSVLLSDNIADRDADNISIDGFGPGLYRFYFWDNTYKYDFKKICNLPDQPIITSVTISGSTATVNFRPSSYTPNNLLNPSSAITNYSYQLSYQSTTTPWTLFNPAITTSPAQITGLLSGIQYTIKMRANIPEGGGLPSDPFTFNTLLDASSTMYIVGTDDFGGFTTFSESQKMGLNQAGQFWEKTLNINSTPTSGYLEFKFATGPFGQPGQFDWGDSNQDGVAGLGEDNIRLYTSSGLGAYKITFTPSNSTYSVLFVTPVSNPPTLGTFTSTANSITLSFTPPTFTGGLPITEYRYSLNNGAFTSTSPVTQSSPITITGLTESTAYSIRLVAVTSAGSSAPSTAINASTTGPAYSSMFIIGSASELGAWNTANGPAMTSISGSGGYGWSADINFTSIGSVEFKFFVQRDFNSIGWGDGTDQDGIAEQGGNNIVRNIASAGLYRISFSTLTRAYSIQLVSSVPSAPTISAVSIPSNSTTSATLTLATSQSGAGITNYAYSLNSGTFTDISPATGSVGSITVTGLLSGTTYTARLVAKNAAGSSPASNSVEFKTPVSTMYVPGLMGSWPGSTDPFSEQNSFQMSRPTWVDDGHTWTLLAPINTLPANNNISFKFATGPNWSTGLNWGAGNLAGTAAQNGPDITHNFSSGPGVYTVTFNTRQLTYSITYSGAIQSAPSITSITPSDTSLTVNFTLGSSNGTTVTGLEYSLNGGGWQARNPQGTSSPLVITGLSLGVTYSVSIRSISNNGRSAASSTVSQTTSATLTPPFITSVSPASTTSLSVAYTASTASAGYSVTGYQYSLDNGSWLIPSGSSSSANPMVITGLTAGTFYSVRIRATGTPPSTSQPSASNTAVTAYATMYIPGLIGNFNTPFNTTGQVTMASGLGGDLHNLHNWWATHEITSTGNVSYKFAEGPSWNDDNWGVADSANPSGSLVSGGVNITRSVTTLGIYEITCNIRTLTHTFVLLSSAPAITSITSAGGQLSVNFTAPSNNPSTITSYEYSTDNGATWRARSSGATESPLVISTISGTANTTLVPGTAYQVRIRARYDGATQSYPGGAKVLNSPASTAVSATPTASTDAPSAFRVLTSTDTLTADFISPNTNQNTITNYQYSLDGGQTWTAMNPSVTSKKFDHVVLTIPYTTSQANVGVRAVTSAGTGAASSFVSVSRPTGSSVTTTLARWGSQTLRATIRVSSSNTQKNHIRGYEYSTDEGLTWISLSSESLSGRINITGLTNVASNMAGTLGLIIREVYATGLKGPVPPIPTNKLNPAAAPTASHFTLNGVGSADCANRWNYSGYTSNPAPGIYVAETLVPTTPCAGDFRLTGGSSTYSTTIGFPSPPWTSSSAVLCKVWTNLYGATAPTGTYYHPSLGGSTNIWVRIKLSSASSYPALSSATPSLTMDTDEISGSKTLGDPNISSNNSAQVVHYSVFLDLATIRSGSTTPTFHRTFGYDKGISYSTNEFALPIPPQTTNPQITISLNQAAEQMTVTYPDGVITTPPTILAVVPSYTQLNALTIFFTPPSDIYSNLNSITRYEFRYTHAGTTYGWETLNDATSPITTRAMAQVPGEQFNIQIRAITTWGKGKESNFMLGTTGGTTTAPSARYVSGNLDISYTWDNDTSTYTVVLGIKRPEKTLNNQAIVGYQFGGTLNGIPITFRTATVINGTADSETPSLRFSLSAGSYVIKIQANTSSTLHGSGLGEQSADITFTTPAAPASDAPDISGLEYFLEPPPLTGGDYRLTGGIYFYNLRGTIGGLEYKLNNGAWTNIDYYPLNSQGQPRTPFYLFTHLSNWYGPGPEPLPYPGMYRITIRIRYQNSSLGYSLPSNEIQNS